MKHPIGRQVIPIDRGDETIHKDYIGRVGRVTEHYENLHIGDTLEDPLHGVRFLGGKESFWYEELKPINLIARLKWRFWLLCHKYLKSTRKETNFF